MSKGADGPLGQEREDIFQPVLWTSGRFSPKDEHRHQEALEEVQVPCREWPGPHTGQDGGGGKTRRLVREAQRRPSGSKGANAAQRPYVGWEARASLLFPGGTKLRSKDGCGRGGKTSGHPDSVLVPGGP